MRQTNAAIMGNVSRFYQRRKKNICPPPLSAFRVEMERLRMNLRLKMVPMLGSFYDPQRIFTPEGSWKSSKCDCGAPLWARLPSAAAGLSVVSLLHRTRLVLKPRLRGLVHQQLQRHLSEHLTHRHLWDRVDLSLGVRYAQKGVTLVPPGSGVSWTCWCWSHCSGQFSLETFWLRVCWLLREGNADQQTAHSTLVCTWNRKEECCSSLDTWTFSASKAKSNLMNENAFLSSNFKLFILTIITIEHHHACHFCPDAFASVVGLWEHIKESSRNHKRFHKLQN